MRFSAACISASLIDAARHLARHVALDGGERLVDGLLLEVVERHIVAGQRYHVGDAVAHLACADDADLLDDSAVRSCPCGP